MFLWSKGEVLLSGNASLFFKLNIMKSGKAIFLTLIIFLLIYLMFAFVIMELNANNWTNDLRFMYVIISCVSSILSIIFIENKNDFTNT